METDRRVPESTGEGNGGTKTKEPEEIMHTLHAGWWRESSRARTPCVALPIGNDVEIFCVGSRIEARSYGSSVPHTAADWLILPALADFRPHLPRGDYSNRLAVRTVVNRRGSVNATASMGDWKLKGRFTRMPVVTCTNGRLAAIEQLTWNLSESHGSTSMPDRKRHTLAHAPECMPNNKSSETRCHLFR